MNCELYRLRKELNDLQKCLDHYDKRIQFYEGHMRNKSSDVQQEHDSILESIEKRRIYDNGHIINQDVANNAALLAVAYPPVMEYMGMRGEKEREEIHQHFCGEYWGWKEYDILGKKKVSPVRTTTKNNDGEKDIISKSEMYDFYRFIQQRAAENGIFVPDPDPRKNLDVRNGINNKTNKPVIKLNLDGLVLAEYHSMQHAARMNNTFASNISKCCKGEIKTAGGFRWIAA